MFPAFCCYAGGARVQAPSTLLELMTGQLFKLGPINARVSVYSGGGAVTGPAVGIPDPRSSHNIKIKLIHK